MAREKRNTAIYTAFDDHETNNLPIPEKSLLRAILLNAIADINRHDETSRKAREYFLSKEEDYIFSFQAVCSYLQINPRHILVLVGLAEGKHTNSTVTQSTEGASQKQGDVASSPETIDALDDDRTVQ
ncbi:MAG: hypothetical protein RL326_1307 [Pseudomonadota bacterium]|jgi:hypothetical protein